MYANTESQRPFTVPDLRRMKQAGTAIVVLTAYDASGAALLDAAGIDVALVGDSLGMVVQGARNTLSVSVEDIAYHTRAVRAGLKRALLMADLPFLSYATRARALRSAEVLIGAAGADMLKLEGGEPPMLAMIEFLAKREVPVCAHLGLTPQSVLRLGGYKVQGREQAAHEAIVAQAHAVAAAGAAALVLECVPDALAKEVTAAIDIPTIGIGAGVHCDGQVLVMHDMLGMACGRRPRFVKDFLSGTSGVRAAFEAYAQAVRERSFPGEEHSYA